jgi:dTDP-6-deoxy-L-talose 4-dehydrogenase (NAD+)
VKLLLTGANGFIGSAFARQALAGGHQVAGLILPGEQPKLGADRVGQLEWIRGTLESVPWSEIQAFRPEVCIHTAWVTTPGVYMESPENLRFLHSSSDFLRKAVAAGVKHVVGLGTCIEYAITGQPLSELTTPVSPESLYARCKNELRLWLEKESAPGRFTWCWGRVFYPYGPGEHPSRLCSSLLAKLSRGEKLVLKTPASTKDYIFIDDLGEALLTVVEREVRGPINLGTGTGIPVRDIARTLAELAGKPGLVEEANPPSQDPLGSVVADASMLRGLGWKPRHSLEDGLRKLIEHFQR